MEKHVKHTQLVKRENGNFAPNEIAIMGTTCAQITELVKKISSRLREKANIAYLDASHNTPNHNLPFDQFIIHQDGMLESKKPHFPNPYNDRILFSDYDLFLVNGNHFAAEKQILFLNEEKAASLEKRLDRLSRIQFVIYATDSPGYFPFLSEKFPNIGNIRAYHINELDKITDHVHNLVKEKIAPIKGLVLAGGKSSRMGKDKTKLDYHGVPQLEYTMNLLKESSLDTYISVAEEVESSRYKIIPDTFKNLGPFGAICSAFRKDPNKAWLVMATDLPFVDKTLIKKLLSKRNPKKIATSLKGKSKPFVEPLITIYEPKAYPVLLSFLSQGYSCPRKVLINSPVEIVEVEDALIQNINTPEDYRNAIDELKK